MFSSIIGISPQILNDTINVLSQPPVDYTIFQAGITLLAGLLIFVTLLQNFSFVWFIQKKGSEKLTRHLDPFMFLFFSMFVFPCISIALSLFAETVFLAKIFFIFSLVTLLICVLTMLSGRPLGKDRESDE